MVTLSSRRSRLLISLILLVLVASPLSSGDKGLWLSFGSALPRLLDAPLQRLTAEHSTLLPDRSGSRLAAARVSRPDPPESATSLAVVEGGRFGATWTPVNSTVTRGAGAAGHAAPAPPRGPPA